MKRDVQAVVLVLVGAALLRITLHGDMFLRYVKSTVRIPLILAGAVLLLLGLVGVVRDGLQRVHESEAHHDEHTHEHEHEGHDGHEHHEHHEEAGHDAHGHDHSRGPKIAWLVCLPVLALFLIGPPALGSYTASRAPQTIAKPAAAADDGFPDLPAGNPLDMTLGDFDTRAVWDSAGHLRGRNVRMTGFVVPGKAGGWYLARMVISCCAADATTFKVEMHGVPAPPTDAWVTVTGTWLENGQVNTDSAIPALTVTTLQRVSQPTDPYE